MSYPLHHQSLPVRVSRPSITSLALMFPLVPISPKRSIVSASVRLSRSAASRRVRFPLSYDLATHLEAKPRELSQRTVLFELLGTGYVIDCPVDLFRNSDRFEISCPFLQKKLDDGVLLVAHEGRERLESLKRGFSVNLTFLRLARE